MRIVFRECSKIIAPATHRDCGGAQHPRSKACEEDISRFDRGTGRDDIIDEDHLPSGETNRPKMVSSVEPDALRILIPYPGAEPHLLGTTGQCVEKLETFFPFRNAVTEEAFGVRNRSFQDEFHVPVSSLAYPGCAGGHGDDERMIRTV